MTVEETAAVLRVHQGPFFDGVTSRCGCRRIVQTADEWARHVAEEIRAAESPNPYPQCAWCPTRARGDALHNDGRRYPSCGTPDHGREFVP